MKRKNYIINNIEINMFKINLCLLFLDNLCNQNYYKSNKNNLNPYVSPRLSVFIKVKMDSVLDFYSIAQPNIFNLKYENCISLSSH